VHIDRHVGPFTRWTPARQKSEDFRQALVHMRDANPADPADPQRGTGLTQVGVLLLPRSQSRLYLLRDFRAADGCESAGSAGGDPPRNEGLDPIPTGLR
jgi:hypothetical protein